MTDVEVKDASGCQIHSLIDVDGYRMWRPTFRTAEEQAEHVRNVVNVPLRDDDIMFCSAPKSGTHWIFEILSMLFNGNTESIPHGKSNVMLEAFPQSTIDEFPSPRVLNSHLPLHMLPKEMKEKKTKIVLALRNPKDVCVSFYHHHKGMRFYNYDGEFDDYVPTFLAGELDYGNWFDYVLDMEKEMEKGDYDIHLIYFEDLKENGFQEIKKLANFLCLSDNETLWRAIIDKCDIKKMKKDKNVEIEKAESFFKSGFGIYRKGEIGDWKNHFTVAKNEEFDKVYEERMSNSKLNFKFTPSK